MRLKLLTAAAAPLAALASLVPVTDATAQVTRIQSSPRGADP